MSEQIRQALDEAIAYLSANPSDALYTDSLATAVLEGGLHVRVSGPEGAAVTTDMPMSVGGAGGGLSPGWLLRAAEASCVATLISMRAAYLGVVINSLEVAVDSQSDDRGILGIDPGVPAGPLSTRVRVRLDGAGVNKADAEAIVGWAMEHCPVTDAVRRAVPLTLELDLAD